MFLTCQPYDFDAIAYIRLYLIWCITTVENLVGIVWTVFEKIEKSQKIAVLAIFGLILAVFLTSQPYDFDAIEHIGL